ncbi:hypothetical protein FDH38_gp075 [Dinoroseobacter phage vB_DshS-R5C]|uniref:Uncharacterized protein n=1 Tax=Dinoroseobacter phage vB_DshS-R5C TaxID=1965368 RepID=A0A1V0DYA7_9CAUD|nr:hypothetical protein FDH38_gp075 [Dinoroseobacter phage vB_DshS-R5C]ARB06129.1 hypothetical protein vBDshSR5C_75 [Dinoroseobacter phage vB_DshS-R5C]
MAASKKTEVAQAKEAGLPAELMDELALDGEQHRETMSKDDMSIPFLAILQSLSPQCTRGEAEYIKGAEPSDLFDTVTQRLFKTRDEDDNAIPAEIRIMPIHYKRSFIEWVPRNKGGGMVQEYSVEDGLSINTARNDMNQDIIQDGSPLGTPGNQLVDTHTHFVFVIHPDGSFEPMILALSSTQLKPSKDLNNMVSKHRLPNGAQAARFFGVYSITTQFRSNEKGSWYIWKFEKVDDVAANNDLLPMYREAKTFVEGIKSGEHKADYSKMDGEENPGTDDAAPADGGGDGDEEIPF